MKELTYSLKQSMQHISLCGKMWEHIYQCVYNFQEQKQKCLSEFAEQSTFPLPGVIDHSYSHGAPSVVVCIPLFLGSTSIAQTREKDSVIPSFHLFGMLTSLFVEVPFSDKPVNLPVTKGRGPCF